MCLGIYREQNKIKRCIYTVYRLVRMGTYEKPRNSIKVEEKSHHTLPSQPFSVQIFLVFLNQEQGHGEFCKMSICFQVLKISKRQSFRRECQSIVAESTLLENRHDISQRPWSDKIQNKQAGFAQCALCQTWRALQEDYLHQSPFGRALLMVSWPVYNQQRRKKKKKLADTILSRIDLKTGEQTVISEHTKPVRYVVYDPDDRFINL